MVLGDIAFDEELYLNAKLIVVDCSDGKNLYNGMIVASDVPKEAFEELFEGTPHRHTWKSVENKSKCSSFAYAAFRVIALSVEKNCLFVAIR